MKPINRASQPHPSGRRIAGRAQLDRVLDPYVAQRKPHEPTVCTECGAVYRRGRWQWGPKPADAAEMMCPACRRVHDRLPAGIVTVHGGPAQSHRDEIIRLARREEELEKPEHPLNRIMAVEDGAEGLVITTTDIHLPRRIGETLQRAVHGDLGMHFDEEGYFVRVDWRPAG